MKFWVACHVWSITTSESYIFWSVWGVRGLQRCRAEGKPRKKGRTKQTSRAANLPVIFKPSFIEGDCILCKLLTLHMHCTAQGDAPCSWSTALKAKQLLANVCFFAHDSFPLSLNFLTCEMNSCHPSIMNASSSCLPLKGLLMHFVSLMFKWRRQNCVCVCGVCSDSNRNLTETSPPFCYRRLKVWCRGGAGGGNSSLSFICH